MKRVYLPTEALSSLANFRFCAIEYNSNDQRFGEDPSVKIEVWEDVIGRTACQSYYIMKLVAKQRGEKFRGRRDVLIYQLIREVSQCSLPKNLR